jgi:glycosyltransferase involved in cell wall biosynthesis
MFLAKAFHTDPRPRQEARSLIENNYRVYVLAWSRECCFKTTENVDGSFVRTFHGVKTADKSRALLALGALVFQVFLVLESVRLIIRIRERPIIHAHDFNTLLPGCLLRMLGLCTSLIYDCHEFSFAAYSELFNNFTADLIRTIEEVAIRYTDAVVTVSDPIARYLRRFNPVTETIYNCPRASEVPIISKKEARVRLGLPADAFIVSQVGTIRYDSKLDLLLAVAKLVKSENIHFVVVGGGPLAREFGQAATETAREVQLTVLSQVPREKALLYVSASDLTWVIYAQSENARMTFPWKFFESMACGVPMIVERGTLRAAFVEKRRCGLVAESDNPAEISRLIFTLASKPHRHQEMADAAKLAGREFAWEAMSSKLINLYAQTPSRG